MRQVTRHRRQLIDIHETALRLGVSERYIRRLVSERRIPHLKLGRLLRFDAEVIDAWLQTCEVGVTGDQAGAARRSR